MLEINEILKVSNETTFNRGKTLYEEDYILEGSYRQIRNLFLCNIVSSRKDNHYPVSLTIDNGEIIEYSCTCLASDQYPGLCKHAVALAFYIANDCKIDNESFLERQQRRQKEQQRQRETSMFSAFAQVMDYETFHSTKFREEHNESTTLSFEYILLFEDKLRLSVKVGIKQKYVIKNFIEFEAAIENKSTLIFGKNFTYDPSIHSIDEKDMQVLELIFFYFNIRDTVSANYYYHSTSKKNVELSETFLDRFFEIIGNDEIFLKHYYQTKGSLQHGFSPTFNVVQMDNNIHINTEYNIDYVSDQFGYILYDDKLYKVEEEKRHILALWYRQISFHDSLVFSDERTNDFFSNILPALKMIGKVSVADQIYRDIDIQPLNAQLYLTRQGDAIHGELFFHYGESEIGIIPENKPNTELVRDSQKEMKIINILNHSIDYITDDEFVVESEDKIFEFFNYYLSQLEELCTIFGTDQIVNLFKKRLQYKMEISFNESTNLFDFNFDFENISLDDLPSIYEAIKEKKRFHRLSNGSLIGLDNNENETLKEIIEGLDLDVSTLGKENIQVQKSQAFYLEQLTREKETHSLKRDHYFKNLVSKIKNYEDVDYPISDHLENILRDYQVTGYNWLRTLAELEMGGILADDMGLGKTLQTISLINELERDYPVIVIAPTSLVLNWKKEISKFSPNLEAVVLHGNKNERQEILAQYEKFDIIITSYGTLRRDIKLYEKLIFSACIIDEAQHIKNSSSLAAKAVKVLNANYRFALTGTPIENSLAELWSIFDFILPGYLKKYSQFKKDYEKPIVKDNNIEIGNRLKLQITPFILRRLKRDVLTELPPKIETKISCELTDKQKEVYLAYLSEFKHEIDGYEIEGTYRKNTMKVLSALTRLRQICCDPSLFIEDYKGESAKLIALEELLNNAISSGHRVLIFSQFTSMLNIISNKLEKNNISYYYLDGQTHPTKRIEMVEEFNKGVNDVFLISLKAGGSGLNLTGADMVIHYDPWWNPAVEDQATDRAYRIGQDKSVQVIKMVTEGTIEEKIFEIQAKKKSLVDAVIKPGESFITKLSDDEIKNLFN